MTILKVQLPMAIVYDETRSVWAQIRVTRELLDVMNGRSVIFIEGNVTGKDKSELLIRKEVEDPQWASSMTQEQYKQKRKVRHYVRAPVPEDPPEPDEH